MYAMTYVIPQQKRFGKLNRILHVKLFLGVDSF